MIFALGIQCQISCLWMVCLISTTTKTSMIKMQRRTSWMVVVVEDKISLNWIKSDYLPWIIALLLWVSNLESIQPYLQQKYSIFLLKIFFVFFRAVKKEASRFREVFGGQNMRMNGRNNLIYCLLGGNYLLLKSLGLIFSFTFLVRRQH